MRFKKLKISVALTMIVFVLIVTAIFSFGYLQKIQLVEDLSEITLEQLSYQEESIAIDEFIRDLESELSILELDFIELGTSTDENVSTAPPPIQHRPQSKKIIKHKARTRAS